MVGNALQQVARARAEELPAARTTLPFGPDHDVAKVLGKMFLLLTEVRGPPVTALKAEPRDAEALRGARRPVDPQTFLAAEGGTATSSTDGPET